MVLRRALLSLTDKRGAAEFARGLAQRGVEILSTGNTARLLREAGVQVTEVADFTGFPEILDGRVKTLHPRVHGGILARRDDERHRADMERHGLDPIDLVAVNLYPFERVTQDRAVDLETAIENIDIGGPSMIRSAAKNHEHVVVLVDPDDYPRVLEELEQTGAVAHATRRALARKAFERTAAYDAAIAGYLQGREEFGGGGEPWRSTAFLRTGPGRALRYGENPHQQAAFFPLLGAREPSVSTARVLNGKELSYNNLVDLDAAFQLVGEFVDPACAVIKHSNPCGAAAAADLGEAFARALAGDPLSAFGGILACNRPLDAATAERVARPENFFECIIAPEIEPEAQEILTKRVKWGGSVRLLAAGSGPGDAWDLEVRKVRGGILVQTRDPAARGDPFEHQAGPPPDPALEASLRFAWIACKHVKSNAIVLASDRAFVGVGAGQMSRVDSVRLAVEKAGARARGAVLASDAFFPFRDGIDAAAAAGITAIVQPGGSRRDAEVLAAAEEHGITMLFTGRRHFRH